MVVRSSDAIGGVPANWAGIKWVGGIVSDSETIPAQIRPAQIRIPPRSAARPSITSGDAGTPHFQSNAAVEIANLGRVAHKMAAHDPADFTALQPSTRLSQLRGSVFPGQA